MRVLENLSPVKVFSFFEDICAIPHGSGNTAKICDYLVDFATARGLEYRRDELNNLIIKKPASSGYEHSEGIIMQAHIDMVCEKISSCSKDMSVEGLDLIVDGEYVTADGTTLGADNGIGVAYILAVLDDNKLSHPYIEAVFTVDEEVGLLGAAALDVSHLKSKRMLNLDIECEDEITVSCAGGINSKCTFDINRADFKGDSLKITVSGLSGGHSGVAIKNGGANSHVLMSRILLRLSKECNIRIASIEGGFKDNVIPVQTTSLIVSDNINKCIEFISAIESEFKNEYIVTDPELNLKVECADYLMPLSCESHNRILHFITQAIHGVQVMSSNITGLVQTSLNFAVVNFYNDSCEFTFSVRSSVSSQKSMLVDRLQELTSYLDGRYETYGEYPGWEYNPTSDFRDSLIAACEKILGKSPKIEAIHAGLECGLFSNKISGLDCISYGPDIYGIHTPEERLSVSSVNRVWNVIIEFLKNLK